MPRIHRVDPNQPGLTRRRRGRGFAYLDEVGTRVEDDATLERIRGLAIPPAWREVWISPDPFGHIQATGVDDAGRRQYRYHDVWRERRDRAKHHRVEAFGANLPKLRRRVSRDLARQGLERERVLAGAMRILDPSALRIGGEEYARSNGSFGLATLLHDHVRTDGSLIEMRFNGKAGVEHAVEIRDRRLAELVRELEREGPEELLGWIEDDAWHDVRASDINQYLKAIVGEEHSAKDFRTWHATVLASALLATHDPREGRRAVTAVMKEVAEQLGNTPAVCRASYVNPRVVDRFLDEGRTIRPRGRGAASDRGRGAGAGRRLSHTRMRAAPTGGPHHPSSGVSPGSVSA